MIQSVREKYNAEFNPEKYKEFLEALEKTYNKEVVFRVAETPIFVDKILRQKLIDASEQIVDIICKPDFKEASQRAIPAQYNVKNENDHTHFICIDFAICKDEKGELTPQLIELQGFASLYSWQWFISKMYKEYFYCPEGFSPYFSGLNDKTYLDLLRKVLIGKHELENVVLLELRPHEQKTRIDFYIANAELGINIVCLSEVIQRENKLFYKIDDREVEIKRVYNRLIFDDLEANKEFKYDVDLFRDIDVEWVSHPNWFYRISKYTMPMLHNEFVPETFFLNELKTIPTDLENYVLKPLFSFSGMGVIIDVTRENIEDVTDPENWILQRKVQYAEALASPEGGVKCEIRMMYLWPDGDTRPTLAVNLARMSRGKMIGVRYNSNFNWVGGTVAFLDGN